MAVAVTTTLQVRIEPLLRNSVSHCCFPCRLQTMDPRHPPQTWAELPVTYSYLDTPPWICLCIYILLFCIALPLLHLLYALHAPDVYGVFIFCLFVVFKICTEAMFNERMNFSYLLVQVCFKSPRLHIRSYAYRLTFRTRSRHMALWFYTSKMFSKKNLPYFPRIVI